MTPKRQGALPIDSVFDPQPSMRDPAVQLDGLKRMIAHEKLRVISPETLYVIGEATRVTGYSLRQADGWTPRQVRHFRETCELLLADTL